MGSQSDHVMEVRGRFADQMSAAVKAAGANTRAAFQGVEKDAKSAGTTIDRSSALAVKGLNGVERAAQRAGAASGDALRKASGGVGDYARGLEKANRGLGIFAQGMNAAALAGGRTGAALQSASSVLMGFAVGGPILGGISLLVAGLGMMSEKSRRAKEEAEKLAEAQKKAAEEAARHAEELRKQAAARDEYNRGLQIEIDLLNARSDAERRSIENAERLRQAREQGGSKGEALEARRQGAEAAARRREADAKRAEDSAARVAEHAKSASDHEKALGEKAKATVDALREQADQRARALTTTAEQRALEDDLATIAALRAAGDERRAKALETALEYARALADYEKKSAEHKEAKAKADESSKRAAENAKAEGEARRQVVDRLSEELDIARQTNEQERTRIARLYELNRIRKEGGEEAVRLQKELWELEEKTAEAAKKAADAKARAAKGGADPSRGIAGSKGVGGAKFDEDGNFQGLGLADARQARRNATRSQKRARAEKARGRMGRSIHDGRMSGLGGIRSGRRGLGSASSWYGGSNKGTRRGFREPVNPSLKDPGGGGGDGLPPPPVPPGRPGADPKVTTEGGGLSQEGKAVEEAARAQAESLRAMAEAEAAMAKALGDTAKSADDTKGAAETTKEAVEETTTKMGEAATAAEGLAEAASALKSSGGKSLDSLVTTMTKVANDLREIKDKLAAAELAGKG